VGTLVAVVELWKTCSQPGTYRPADVTLAEHPLKTVKQDLLVHQLCGEIALQPLTEADVGEYLASDSPCAAVPEGLVSCTDLSA